jgi:hypothetical protein
LFKLQPQIEPREQEEIGMSTASFVRRHVYRLPVGVPFAARELMAYGSAPAVYRAIYRLIKKEVIRRIAQGVYMKYHWKCSMPSAFEIARLKAEVFGKFISMHGADAALELGLSSQRLPHPTFYVSGRSSSFRYGALIVKLQGINMRRLRLGESRAAKTIAAFWSLGKSASSESRPIWNAVRFLGRLDKLELQLSKPWMPEWLGRHFISTHYYDPVQMTDISKKNPRHIDLPLPVMFARPA